MDISYIGEFVSPIAILAALSVGYIVKHAITGAVSGLASTGLYEAFSNFIGIKDGE